MKNDDQTKIWVVVGLVIITVIIGVFIHSHKNSRLGGNGECNNNYSGTCVPNVAYDIDCKDIRHKVTVVGKDVYHFDADRNGVGCESY